MESWGHKYGKTNYVRMFIENMRENRWFCGPFKDSPQGTKIYENKLYRGLTWNWNPSNHLPKFAYVPNNTRPHAVRKQETTLYVAGPYFKVYISERRGPLSCNSCDVETRNESTVRSLFLGTNSWEGTNLK